VSDKKQIEFRMRIIGGSLLNEPQSQILGEGARAPLSPQVGAYGIVLLPSIPIGRFAPRCMRPHWNVAPKNQTYRLYNRRCGRCVTDYSFVSLYSMRLHDAGKSPHSWRSILMSLSQTLNEGLGRSSFLLLARVLGRKYRTREIPEVVNN